MNRPLATARVGVGEQARLNDAWLPWQLARHSRGTCLGMVEIDYWSGMMSGALGPREQCGLARAECARLPGNASSERYTVVTCAAEPLSVRPRLVCRRFAPVPALLTQLPCPDEPGARERVER